jgi:hypothetical protein
MILNKKPHFIDNNLRDKKVFIGDIYCKKNFFIWKIFINLQNIF